jgi:CNT family concentrative nucleoside transporter
VNYRERGWIIPFLLWLALTVRLIFFYLPSSKVMKLIRFTWNHTTTPLVHLIPPRLRMPAAGAATAAIIIITALADNDITSDERVDRVVSLIGLGLAIVGLWGTSKHRSQIAWQTVIVGMLAQFIIALFVLRSEAGFAIFQFVSGLAGDLLGYSKSGGMAFLTSDAFVEGSGGSFYLVGVLPAIALFVAIVQVVSSPPVVTLLFLT